MSTKVKYIPSYGVKLAFLILALLMLFGAILFHVNKRKVFKELLIENALMPTFSDEDMRALVFQSEQKKPVSIAEFSGSWLLINFWATWCPPCREEMPSLNKLSLHFADKLKIIAVSVDDSWDAVSKFFLEQPASYILAWDPDKNIADKLNIDRYPETFLINPQGQSVARFSGPRNWASADALQYFSRYLNKAPQKS